MDSSTAAGVRLRHKGRGRVLAVLALLPILGACRTRRVLDVTSVPSGAFVRLDEEVIGKTPLEHEFVHYGKRRLSLYYSGYKTWSERIDLAPPLRARFPLDIFTELLLPLGLMDRTSILVKLVPDTGDESDSESLEIDEMVRRAVERRRSTESPVQPPAQSTSSVEGDGGQ